jgi:hypothetical protein
MRLAVAMVVVAVFGVGSGVCTMARPGEQRSPGEQPASEAEPAIALPPTIQEMRLQTVPPPIANAYCDYRGRMWFTVYQSTLVRDGCVVNEVSLAPAIRQQVERQWNADQPVVIKGGEIALFEPGGRVWIVSGSELLGYDGKSWQTGRMYRMEAACAGHGRLRAYPSTWVVGSMSFFSSPTDDGLTCFDGTRWIPWNDPDVRTTRKDYFWKLAGLRDGTGLIAWNTQPNEAWVFRWGRWHRLLLPPELTEGHPDFGFASKRHVYGLAVEAHNDLWLLLDKHIVSFPLGHAAEVDVDTLKTGLDHPKAPALKKITATGSYTFDSVWYLSQEHNGTIVMSAEHVQRDGRDLGGGLLIIGADGSTRFVANLLLVQIESLFLTLDKKRLVVMVGQFPNSTSGFIDLQEMELTYRPFNVPNTFVQCATGDGRYYLSDGPYWYRNGRGVLHLLDPNKPEDH